MKVSKNACVSMERAISGLLPYKRRALGGRQEHAFLQTKRQNEDDFI